MCGKKFGFCNGSWLLAVNRRQRDGRVISCKGRKQGLTQTASGPTRSNYMLRACVCVRERERERDNNEEEK